jgi:hypothetical protein
MSDSLSLFDELLRPGPGASSSPPIQPVSVDKGLQYVLVIHRLWGSDHMMIIAVNFFCFAGPRLTVYNKHRAPNMGNDLVRTILLSI